MSLRARRRRGRTSAPSGSSAPGCSARASGWRSVARWRRCCSTTRRRPRWRWRATSAPARSTTGGAAPDLVVVAAPPDVDRDRWSRAGADGTRTATVTDVASVKLGVVGSSRPRGADLRRYVGGHPMAGRERSGPVAAAGRPVPRPALGALPGAGEPSRTRARRRCGGSATALGAAAVTMAAAEHDAAVALVSHVPQVAASLVAARLRGATGRRRVSLAGQGLRDVTRIAGSDPTLWAQILAANAGPVREVLRELRDDLDDVHRGARGAGRRARRPRVAGARGGGRAADAGPRWSPPATTAATGSRASTARRRRRTPSSPRCCRTRPGSSARLFDDIGEAGINVEEFSLEHAPGQAGRPGRGVGAARRPGGCWRRRWSRGGWHVV